MISPGVFIPLFEENGLTRELDTFVWKETARQIRDRKNRPDYSVPVSVNVSRIAAIVFGLIAALSAVVVFISGLSLTNGYQRMQDACDSYVAAEVAASDMESIIQLFRRIFAGVDTSKWAITFNQGEN